MSKLLDLSEVNGVKVIAQGQAYGSHPRWRDRQVVISGVTTLLLESGEEVHACNVCAATFPRVRSVVAHMSTHTREKKPTTSEETIKAVLRAVKTAMRNGAKYPIVDAIEALNASEYEPVRGGQWTRGSVASIWHRYHKSYTVRIPRRTTSTALADTASAVLDRQPVNTTNDSPFEVPQQRVASRESFVFAPDQKNSSVLAELASSLHDVQRMVTTVDGSWNVVQNRLNTITVTLDKIASLLIDYGKNAAPDPDLVEKARRYDELMTHALHIHRA